MAANRNRLAAAIGLGQRPVIWMNQVHGDQVTRVDDPRVTAVEATDALVTTHAATGAGGGDGRLRAGAVGRRAGGRGRRRCTPGRVGRAARRGGSGRARRCAGGRARRDMSVLLGPAVSGRNYEVPEEMAAEVEAALPGSAPPAGTGTPALDLRAGIASQLATLGVNAIDIDPRCTVGDPTCSVIAGMPRPGGWHRSSGWR